MVFNGAQVHLLVNHLPVIGFLGGVLGLGVAIVSRSIDVKRFVLLGTVLVGFSALLAYWTGEPAEDTIEDMSGVDRALIHEHEEAGEWAMVLGVVTGVAAAGAYALQRRKPESLRRTVPVVFVLSLVTFAAMAKTAHDGGVIRHPELREPG